MKPQSIFKFSCTALLLSACLPLAASAEEKRISDGMIPGDSNSKWVVGGSVGVISNPYLKEDDEDDNEDAFGFITPNVEYRGERLFLKDGQLGFNLLRYQGFGTGVVITGTGNYLSDRDNYKGNDKLRDIKERDPILNGGVYFLHNSELGQARITLLEDIGGDHTGLTADARYIVALDFGRWQVNPMVGVAWASSKSVDHFFGVSEEEASIDHAVYEGKSATNFYTGVRGRFDITDHWDLNLGAMYMKLGDGIADSTLLDKDELFVTTVGMNYNF